MEEEKKPINLKLSTAICLFIVLLIIIGILYLIIQNNKSEKTKGNNNQVLQNKIEESQKVPEVIENTLPTEVNTPENTNISIEQTTKEDEEDFTGLPITIEGVKYTFPMTIQTLLDNGWKEYNKMEELKKKKYTLNDGNSIRLYFIPVGVSNIESTKKQITATIKSTKDNSIISEDMMIVELTTYGCDYSVDKFSSTDTIELDEVGFTKNQTKIKTKYGDINIWENNPSEHESVCFVGNKPELTVKLSAISNEFDIHSYLNDVNNRK